MIKNTKMVIKPKIVTKDVSDSDSVKSESNASCTSYSSHDNFDINLTTPHITRNEIEAIAGFKVGENISMYQRAFVHKSIEKFARLCPESMEYMRQSNETLEMVGDSILGAVVADRLFRQYPDKNEGFLTTARSKIVKSESLANLAIKIGMADKILMANQTIKAGGRNNKRFLEDAFESFIGAMFYDKGFYVTGEFINRVIDTHFDEKMITKNDNYKDILLRYCQHNKISLPEYNIIKESGPPHNKEFLMEVKVLNQRQGKAKAKTVKQAEQLSAKEAIKRLGISENF